MINHHCFRNLTFVLRFVVVVPVVEDDDVIVKKIALHIKTGYQEPLRRKISSNAVSVTPLLSMLNGQV